MTEFDISEQAYKKGFDDGKKETTKEIFKEIAQYWDDDGLVKEISWFEHVCKKYGVEFNEEQKETTVEVDDVGERSIDPETLEKFKQMEKIGFIPFVEDAIEKSRKLTATKIIATICEYLGKNQKFVAVNDERSVWVVCEKLFAFIEKTATEYGVEA